MAVPAAISPQAPAALHDALAQIDALPKPDGVDAKLWNDLKAALSSALTTNNDKLKTKNASTPPTGPANKVNDFSISDHGDGSYSLSWHYKNVGDYDQNGTVGVSDITPLAQHFGETYDTELEANTIQAVVDGSGNGVIGIEDITPIAMNFGVACTGYSLRTSQLVPTFVSDTTGFDVIPLTLAQGEGRIAFGLDHALPSYTYISLAPIDGDDVFGDLSNAVFTPNHSPVAMLAVNPAEGDAPLTVGLDAGESSDVDSPIAKYEWDFEGDGIWDEDSGTVSFVEHVYETPDFYYPVVRVSDDNNARATAEATVFAGQWRITDAVGSFFFGTSAVSLEVVSGNPAMAFYGKGPEVGGEGFSYVRANDPLGASWGEPTLLIGEMTGAADNCDDDLVVVNGRPAVAAMGDSIGDLHYSRAEDADGLIWGTPIEVGYAHSGAACVSMAIVDGKPAIAYVYGQLYYVRALDVDGTSWGTPVEIAWHGIEPCLAIVNGLPAISFRNIEENRLYYVRASDPEGQSWGEPVIVDAQSGVYRGEQSSLAIVNGKPAIAYEFAVDDADWVYGVKYVMANDINGTSWGPPITVAEDAQLGYDKSLAVIQERPAIAYLGYSDDSLRYICAADVDGRRWRAPIVITTDYVQQDCVCLNEVNGNPALGYFAGHGGIWLRFAIYY